MEKIFSLAEIDDAAWCLLKAYPEVRVFVFSGSMGAGKTTFITALCRILGVSDGISSPTFPIINEYRTTSGETVEIIYHIDLYRLKDAEEAILAGVQDSLESGCISFVEWPSVAPSLFDEKALLVTITLTDEGDRMLSTRFFQ